MSEPAPPQFVFHVPDELSAGVYSNVVAVWHSPYEFTLDFAVTLPPERAEDPDGQPVTLVPTRIVSRVKIPPSVVFDLMRTLADNEQTYMQTVGPIPTPGRPEQEPPLYPPES